MFVNNTSVLLIIFNRLDNTEKVFESIRMAKPPKLYISSDGPRSNILDEETVVSDIREFVIKSIDWDCKVYTFFRDTNCGCKNAVTSAIDWFFEYEEMGIILEDDCLPSMGFYQFCQEMLFKYEFDQRISGITGSNFNSNLAGSEFSYFYSEILYMWGWATWKRAWLLNNVFCTNFSQIINSPSINNVSYYRNANKFWLSSSKKAIEGAIDTWDYQWLFANLCDGKSAIVPNKNLVLNIGFGADATHTKHFRKELVVQPQVLSFPLIHPNILIKNYIYDSFFYKNIYGWNSTLGKVKLKFYKILRVV